MQLRWYPVSFLNNNMYLAISSLFDNNYLRNDLVKSFSAAFFCVTFLKVGGLTKSDITFVRLEMFW